MYHEDWFILIAIAALVILPFFGLMYISQKECEAKATKMEMVHSWGMLQGCMVKDANRWWPIERYLVITPTN